MQLGQALQGFEYFLEPRSAVMREIYATISAMARDRRRVLFLGPSGTGKECLARYYLSEALSHGRADTRSPFVSENCACLGSLADSELFGHVRGSFTSAVRDKAGAFELCRDGFLFLDEVGDLPMETQGKLLRALDERSGVAQRLGATVRYPTTGVVVLSATNKPATDIRKDLRERLGHPIRVPGLEQRGEEVAPALRYFLAEALRSRGDFGECRWLERDEGRPMEAALDDIVSGIGDAARRHTWEGNFRSLRRAAEFAVTLADLESRKVFVADTKRIFRAQMTGDVATSRSRTRSTGVAPALPNPALEGCIEEIFARKHPKLKKKEVGSIARCVASHAGRVMKRSDLEKATGVSATTARNRLRVLIDVGVVKQLESGFEYRVVDGPPERERLALKPRVRTLVPAPPGPGLPEERLRDVEEICALIGRRRGVYVAAGDGEGKTTIGRAIAAKLAGTRVVLWWAFPKNTEAAAGGVEAMLSDIEQELEARGARYLTLDDDHTVDPTVFRAVRLSGYFSSMFSKKGQRPLLILDNVDYVAERSEKEAMQGILRYWSQCQLLLLGGKMPTHLETVPDQATLAEHRISRADRRLKGKANDSD